MTTSLSMSKMFQVKTLRALTACTVIDENIPISLSSIPSTMFEELKTLGSLHCLRKYEKLMDEKIDRLKVERQKAIEKSDDYHMDSNVLFAINDYVAGFDAENLGDYWEHCASIITSHIEKLEEEKQEISQEEALYLCKLGNTYNRI